MRIVVIGGGVLGTMHAAELVRRGHQVTQLEREPEARGATVRNFGPDAVDNLKAELHVGRRANPGVVPVDRVGTGSAFPQFIEALGPFPQDSERVRGPRRPFPEKDLRGFEGVDVQGLGDDRLGHGPHGVEFERDRPPEGLHDGMDIGGLHHAFHEGSVRV